jgi:hypothetical protein
MDVRRYWIDNHVDSLSEVWLLSSVAEFAATGPALVKESISWMMRKGSG